MVSTNYFHYCPKALLLAFLLIIVAAAAVSASTGASDERKLKVDFTITLDVTHLNMHSYLNFLKDFRRQLATKCTRNVPVLPIDSNDVPPQWVDIVLRNGLKEITMRIKRNNLYVQGYLMQDPRQWLEFGYNRDHEIEGAVFLGFNESYLAMERNCDQDLDTMTLDLEAFKNAVIQLATATDRRIRARWLIILVQMISEGTRFIEMGQHFATTIDGRLPSWFRGLQNDWTKYSFSVLRADADCESYKPVTINGKVMTLDELRDIFGVLHRDPVALLPPCRRLPPCRWLPLQNVELDNTSQPQLLEVS